MARSTDLEPCNLAPTNAALTREGSAGIADTLAWVGVAIACGALVRLIAIDVHAVAAAEIDVDGAALRASALTPLRAAWLFIAVGVLSRTRDSAPRWRGAVRGAVAMLVCSAAADVYGALAAFGAVPDYEAMLGDIDAVQRRLLRLAAMAARAVPLLALLAAIEAGATRVPPVAAKSQLMRVLLRAEPHLFAVGACLLAPLLAAAAFVHLDWRLAVPVAADATVLATVAALGRAFAQADRSLRFGWAAVCAGMGLGLLMGAYAFGGPLPPPSVLGDYLSLRRTLVRDAHILIVSAGLLVITLHALGARRKEPR